MNLLISAAEIYTPEPIKQRKLRELFACTAAAFACDMPPTGGLSYDDLLAAYARFTAEQADRVIRRGDDLRRRSRSRLYAGAYRMGQELRGMFRITTTAEALAAARVLYRALGIDLHATPTGEITVRRCFFSAYYAAPVCRLIASLDEGLFAGLSNGGRLAFTQAHHGGELLLCGALPGSALMRRAIVVGTGAGGATVAKELQGRFDVTVLEAGEEFRPFTRVPLVESIKKTGLLFDAREIQLVFPAYRVRRAGDGMILVNGHGLGGTTTLCTGNALRMDGDLRALGLDLDAEFDEIAREIPISTAHRRRWHKEHPPPVRDLPGDGAGPPANPQDGGLRPVHRLRSLRAGLRRRRKVG